MKKNEIEDSDVRLDKWLWAARFYKTRTLSQDNIELGRVRMNGVRLKASKTVKVGEKLEIIRGEERFEVIVKALSGKRGNAAAAQALYEETPGSLQKRLLIRENSKMMPIQAVTITAVLRSVTGGKSGNSLKALILQRTFKRKGANPFWTAP